MEGSRYRPVAVCRLDRHLSARVDNLIRAGRGGIQPEDHHPLRA